MSMMKKLIRVVTYNEKLPSIESKDSSGLARSSGKLDILYHYYSKSYGH